MKPPGALVFASAFLIGSALGAAAFPRQPVTEWVRDLYTAQASRIARAETPRCGLTSSRSSRQKWPRFGKQRIRTASSAHCRSRELDAFFGWRVPLGTRVSFTAVKKVLGTAEAPTLLIDVVVSGVPRRVVLDAVEDDGSWRVANIIYDEGEDFAGFERRLAQP